MRECGECSLCCRLLPVNDGLIVRGTDIRSFHKPAGQRCPHQRHTGCNVYSTPKMPMSCKLWNCRWLVNDDTADLRRPDRSHYVIDIMPDYIEVDDVHGDRVRIEVVQIWIDPNHPFGHQDPSLRAYINRRGKEGKAALIRSSSSDAFVLIPPSLSGQDEFIEIRSNVKVESRVPA